jgi:hypothetical protein
MSFSSLTEWGVHRFLLKIQREQLKAHLSNGDPVNPPLFSLVNTINSDDY